jgi:hypothetical protein
VFRIGPMHSHFDRNALVVELWVYPDYYTVHSDWYEVQWKQDDAQGGSALMNASVMSVSCMYDAVRSTAKGPEPSSSTQKDSLGSDCSVDRRTTCCTLVTPWKGGTGGG